MSQALLLIKHGCGARMRDFGTSRARDSTVRGSHGVIMFAPDVKTSLNMADRIATRDSGPSVAFNFANYDA